MLYFHRAGNERRDMLQLAHLWVTPHMECVKLHTINLGKPELQGVPEPTRCKQITLLHAKLLVKGVGLLSPPIITFILPVW